MECSIDDLAPIEVVWPYAKLLSYDSGLETGLRRAQVLRAS